MKIVYLKIIDIDKFDLVEISDPKEATHYLKVEDDDYQDAISFIQTYVTQIKPYFPFRPEDFVVEA